MKLATIRPFVAGLALLVGASVLAAPAAAAAATPGPVVVVSHLNNPRELSLVSNGILLIAEAGKGGNVATTTSPDGSAQGLGYTGSVSAVFVPQLAHNQQPLRIVTGLLSSAQATDSDQGPAGSGATGPDGVAAAGFGHIAVIETTFFDATPAAAKPFDGHLLTARPFGPVTPSADITGYEVAHDPDGQGVDSDPYAVIAFNGGWLVADAAANDLLTVDKRGAISLFHVFPNVTVGPCSDPSIQDPPGFPGCNFVPTSMALDAQGHVWVGGLSSLMPGAAQVVELSSDGTQVLQTLTGFTAVTGLAFNRAGDLYVSQLFADETAPALPIIQGVLTKISNGTRMNMDVPFPAGIAVDHQGNVYVSAYSILPDTGAGIPGLDTSGQVWRLRF
jgi:hypothetical protein